MALTVGNVYSVFLKALVAWREARGERADAQRGVIWTVQNRAAHPSWWGKDEISVILHPYQYSSFNVGDPNATKFPSSDDTIFQSLLVAAQYPGPDPTDGATSYFSDGIAPPSWATDGSNVFTVKLGALNFYRLASLPGGTHNA